MKTIISVCFLILLGFNAAITADENSIEIGGLLCFTGECADWGTNSKNGMQLAAEAINANGGINGKPLKLVFQDTQETEPVKAVSAWRQLRVSSKAKLFIGPSWTPAGLALAPIIARDKSVIVTSPSLGVRDFNETADNLFNLWPHDEVGSKELAHFAIAQGWKRVAILSSQQPWSKAQGDFFAEEFKSLGGTVLVKHEPLAESRDLRFEVASVRAQNPDAVLFSSFCEQLAIAAKALRAAQFTGPFMTVLMDESTRKSGGEAIKGIYYTKYPVGTSYAEFESKYQARFGEKPGIAADTGYDTMMLYAQALSQSLEIPKLVELMKETQAYSGVSGTINFDKFGGRVAKPDVVKME